VSTKARLHCSIVQNLRVSEITCTPHPFVHSERVKTRPCQPFQLHNSGTSLTTGSNPIMASAFPSRPFTTGLNRSTAGGPGAPPTQTPQPFNTTTAPVYPPQHPSTQQRAQLERGDRLNTQAVSTQNALADLSEEQREEINEVTMSKIIVGNISY
jgi:hypothetical protein